MIIQYVYLGDILLYSIIQAYQSGKRVAGDRIVLEGKLIDLCCIERLEKVFSDLSLFKAKVAVFDYEAGKDKAIRANCSC